MKYLYLFVTLTFLTPLFSSAQSNYKPGYVVTQNADTVKGYVDYKEWIKNPSQFNFKTEINNTAKVYTANNCKAFGVNGLEYYRRYILPISQDKIQISNLTIGPDTTTIIDTAFLKVVTSGKNLTLFTYNDGIKQRFFTTEDGFIAAELIQRLYLDPQETSRIITQKTYTRQLQQLAAKYQPQDDKLIKNIPNAGYSQKDLEQIVYTINGATNYTSVQSAKGAATRFFAGIGLNDATSKIFGFNGNSTLKSSSVLPQINMGMDFFVNKSVGDLLFRLELGFTGNKANFKSGGLQYANAIATSTLKYNQYSGYLNPQLLYNLYNTNTAKIYVAIGVQINYATYTNKNAYTVYTTSIGATQTSNDDEMPDFESFYINLTSKAGFVLSNNLDIYIQYNPYTRINDNEDVAASISSYKVGVSYLFGK